MTKRCRRDQQFPRHSRGFQESLRLARRAVVRPSDSRALWPCGALAARQSSPALARQPEREAQAEECWASPFAHVPARVPQASALQDLAAAGLLPFRPPVAFPLAASAARLLALLALSAKLPRSRLRLQRRKGRRLRDQGWQQPSGQAHTSYRRRFPRQPSHEPPLKQLSPY